jgi:tRNA threonylcarbamoyladenosine biosynthesis protein TsaE
MKSSLISKSTEETFQFARRLAETLPMPAHILLYGDLGAGKTTLTRGLAAGFGIESVDDVASPTFTLINQYKGKGNVRIYHIDLYRIEDGRLDSLGLEEIFDDSQAAVVVEWAERLGTFETPGATRVFLEYVDESSRKIEIR